MEPKIFPIFNGDCIDPKSIMVPYGETFGAERFATLTDKFGTPWMINFAGSRAAT